MGDLTEAAGLPLTIQDSGRLSIPPAVGAARPAVRTLEDMRPYLADPNADGRGPAELYYMYRDLGPAADRAAYAPFGLRFDITVLVPGDVAGELVKTAGHYHPAPGGPGEVSFPEVYGVIRGRAHYLLQDGRVDGPAQAFLVEAGEGEVVVVPPDFGHVTINPGPGPLVMANWVEATFASVYGPYAERRGACHYEFAGPGGQGRLEPNPRYPRPVPLRRLTAAEFAALCPQGRALWRASRLPDPSSGDAPPPPPQPPRPLYRLGVEDPERLAFLVRPASYDWSGLIGRR